MSIEWVLRQWKSDRTCAGTSSNDRACVVERLRPGVARLHSRSAISKLPLQGSLQRVIARMRIARYKLLYAESPNHVAGGVELRVWRKARRRALKSVGERNARQLHARGSDVVGIGSDIPKMALKPCSPGFKIAVAELLRNAKEIQRRDSMAWR